jgi:hypothetical protein
MLLEYIGLFLQQCRYIAESSVPVLYWHNTVVALFVG